MTALTRPVPPDEPPPPSPSSAGQSDPLYPLSRLLDGDRPELVEMLEQSGPTLPEPYRQLLAHERDMTSTLERFYGEAAGLQQLQRRREGSDLWREVLLVGRESGRIMEYGAIRIDLEGFDRAARAAILEGQRPLGSILAHFEVPYRSRPGRFFSLRSTPRLEALLDLDHARELYGRQNVLLGGRGALAEVVEILPPVARSDDSVKRAADSLRGPRLSG